MVSDRFLLKENSINLQFHYSWYQSFFRCLQFSKGRAITPKQSVSSGFLKEIGFTYNRVVKDVVDAYDVSDALNINIDQAPLTIVLIRIHNE